MSGTFSFKLAIYILPGIMFLLVTILILVPAPKPKEGMLQGRIIAPASTSSTLIVESLSDNQPVRTFRIKPGADYQLSLPVGQYKMHLKEKSYSSPQLPRTITITPNSSAIFDITIK